jgi:hypothetical protein
VVFSGFPITPAPHLSNFFFLFDNNFRFTNLQGSIYWKIPPPPLGGEISADVIWGKKYGKVKKKRGKCKKRKKGERK